MTIFFLNSLPPLAHRVLGAVVLPPSHRVLCSPHFGTD